MYNMENHVYLKAIFNNYSCHLKTYFNFLNQTDTYIPNLFLSKAESYDKRHRIEIKDHIDDFIMRQYCTNRPQSNIVILWPKTESIIYDMMINKFEKLGNINAYKVITFCKNTCKSLIIELFFDDIMNLTNIDDKNNFINNKMEKYNLINDNNTVTILLFESLTYDCSKIQKKLDKLDLFDTDYLMTTNHTDAVKLSTIFFCSGSLYHLKTRNIKNILDEELKPTLIKIINLGKDIISTLTPIQKQYYLLDEECYMYVNGWKKCIDHHINIYTVYDTETHIDHICNMFTDERIDKYICLIYENALFNSIKVKMEYEKNKYDYFIEMFITYDDIEIRQPVFFQGIRISNMYYAINIKEEFYTLSDHLDFLLLHQVVNIPNISIIYENIHRNANTDEIKKALQSYLFKDRIRIKMFK